ncbi:MAG: HD domain-containing protein [Candidatus Promineofilum sp.]|nr:HD domain-containing protein [Promineifilum sp.]
MLRDWEARFEQFVRSGLAEGSDPAHDLAHIRRVVANARRLATAEGADPAVVLPAAWLHDCVVLPKDSERRAQASRLAAERAGSFLGEVDYPAALIPAIEHAIAAHSFSAGIRPQTLEAKVVQDADQLDALGAIGIARTLLLGGVMGKPLYHEDEPLPLTRPPNDRENVIDHFYVKLLGLAGMMHTAAGRLEGERRTRLMQLYLDELGRELSGEGLPA